MTSLVLSCYPAAASASSHTTTPAHATKTPQEFHACQRCMQNIPTHPHRLPHAGPPAIPQAWYMPVAGMDSVPGEELPHAHQPAHLHTYIGTHMPTSLSTHGPDTYLQRAWRTFLGPPPLDQAAQPPGTCIREQEQVRQNEVGSVRGFGQGSSEHGARPGI